MNFSSLHDINPINLSLSHLHVAILYGSLEGNEISGSRDEGIQYAILHNKAVDQSKPVNL